MLCAEGMEGTVCHGRLGEPEVFALSRSLGRTTKDNGCDGLGGNCNGEVCRFALVLAAMGWEELMGQCVGGEEGSFLS